MVFGTFLMKRCDLLEKSYLCGINNNELTLVSLSNSVVICLKSLTFVVSITTIRLRSRLFLTL